MTKRRSQVEQLSETKTNQLLEILKKEKERLVELLNNFVEENPQWYIYDIDDSGNYYLSIKIMLGLKASYFPKRTQFLQIGIWSVKITNKDMELPAAFMAKSCDTQNFTVKRHFVEGNELLAYIFQAKI